MKTNDWLTKILAILGTVLVWLPLLAPLLFALASLFGRGRFLFDYLMPAELFPLVLTGAVLLLWAALRAHAWRGLIAGGFGAAMGLLLLGQVIAVVTGLASGATAPTGWQWVLVLATLAGYYLGVAVTGAGGVLLLRRKGNE